MKKRIFLLCLNFISLAVFCQNKVVINGKVPKLIDGTPVLLRMVKANQSIVDDGLWNMTTIVKNKEFHFEFDQAGAELYYLTMANQSGSFYFPPGISNMVIDNTVRSRVHIDNITVLEYQQYLNDSTRNSLEGEYRWLRSRYDDYAGSEHMDSTILNSKEKSLDSATVARQKYSARQCINWISAHPASLINTMILYENLENLSDTTVRLLYSLIPQNSRGNSYAEGLQYNIAKLIVGATAPSLSGLDTLNRDIDLRDYKGKYVLLDFWASWCLPCRKVNPDLRRVYEIFKKNNFTVLGISIDTNKEKWVNAIKEDKLLWPQIIDSGGFHGKAASAYRIKSIPHNYLLDKKGRIIARNVDAEELSKILKSLNK